MFHETAETSSRSTEIDDEAIPTAASWPQAPQGVIAARLVVALKRDRARLRSERALC
jgi:hypothetical protein